MFCYCDVDHQEDLKMPVNKFYTSDAVTVAKDFLWQHHGDSLPSKVNRTSRGTKTPKQKVNLVKYSHTHIEIDSVWSFQSSIDPHGQFKVTLIIKCIDTSGTAESQFNFPQICITLHCP